MLEGSVKIDPKVFKWLRKLHGYSIEEIANILDVQIEKIINIENSTKEVSIQLSYLEKLSNEYNIQLAAFFLSKPLEFKMPKDFRRVAGIATSLKKDTLKAIREAKYIQAVTRGIIEDLGRSYLYIPHYNTKDGPEECARIERKELLGDKSYKNNNAEYFLRSLRSAVELKRSIVVLQLDMPLDDVRGFSLVDEKPYVITINESDSINGKIFTLLHEYAHILLGNSGICMPEESIINPNISNINIVERWCNDFAAAFLMPYKIIHGLIDQINEENAYELIKKSSEKYKVSKYAFIIRLLTLGGKQELFKKLLEEIKLETEKNIKEREEKRFLFVWDDIPTSPTMNIPSSLIDFIKNISKQKIDWVKNAIIKRYKNDIEEYIEISSHDNKDRKYIIIELKGSKAILRLGESQYELSVKKDDKGKRLIYRPVMISLLTKRKAEKGYLFTNLVKEAYNSKIITIHDAMTYLELKDKHIDKLVIEKGHD